MFTEKQKQFIKDNYTKLTYREMSKILNVSDSTISYQAIKLGFNKGSGNYSPKHIYKIDENYFKRWSSNMAYIIGFVLADGNISLNMRHYRLSISLQKQDENILQQIKKELQSEHLITYRNIKTKNKLYESCSLTIDNKNIINTLIKLGITPRKSYNDIVPDIPKKYKYDFLRGYFDGDGCLYIKIRQRGKYLCKDCCMSFTAKTKLFLEKIKQDFCDNFGNIAQSNTWHTLKITSKKQILELCKKMYHNAELYLDRKYQKYKELETWQI